MLTWLLCVLTIAPRWKSEKKFKRRDEREKKASHLFLCFFYPHRNIRVGFRKRVTHKSINNSWAANRESFINCVYFKHWSEIIVKSVDNICARSENLRANSHNLWYVPVGFLFCQKFMKLFMNHCIGHWKIVTFVFDTISSYRSIKPNLLLSKKMIQTFSYEFNEFITKFITKCQSNQTIMEITWLVFYGHWYATEISIQ